MLGLNPHAEGESREVVKLFSKFFIFGRLPVPAAAGTYGGVAIKYVEAGHYFADIVPGYMVIHLLAMFPQQLSAAHFVVVVIQIDTGIHAAFHHLQAGRFPSFQSPVKIKIRSATKTAVQEIFPENGGADVVRMDLRESLAFQLQAQLPQHFLIAVDVVLIKVVGAGDPRQSVGQCIPGRRYL